MLKKLTSGIVTAFSGLKTVKVKVVRTFTHPVYKKTLRRSNFFLCHNELDGVEIGAKVGIVETRPYSKMKKWRVEQIFGN